MLFRSVELESLKLEFQDFSQGTRVLYKWNSSFLDSSSTFFFLVHVRLHLKRNGLELKFVKLMFQKKSNLLNVSFVCYVATFFLKGYCGGKGPKFIRIGPWAYEIPN